MSEGSVAYSDRLTKFTAADKAEVLSRLKDFVADAGSSQWRAWKDSVRLLDSAVGTLIASLPPPHENSSLLLEYTLPLESRRIDALLLIGDVVLVIEFKGSGQPSQAAIDQTAAYARDLRAYHSSCVDRSVVPLLVLVGADGFNDETSGIQVRSKRELPDFLGEIPAPNSAPVDVDEFLSPEAYQPLPSLVRAARELFQSGTLRRIHRAAAATEPALNKCSEIIHATAAKKRRALILIKGVPGAGKTLVGLQLVHSKYLDDLAVARGSGDKPTAPGVFLSGNGPLVEVLQYELKGAGGDGKAFVRGVHEYVKSHTKRSAPTPPHHVLVYDEAQRAFDARQVAKKHRDLTDEYFGLSEPELFVQFAERVPDWSVVVGLIGTGQEIHIGEEAGVGQWRDAIERSERGDQWDIFLPDDPEFRELFGGLENLHFSGDLELKEGIRYHLASSLHEFVRHVLQGDQTAASELAEQLDQQGYAQRLTQDLDEAKAYMRERFQDAEDARYGIITSSRDKGLDPWIQKGFRSPGELSPGQYGRWYSAGLGEQGSCTEMDVVATEFSAQGLELDACIVAWGTDFVRRNGSWCNKKAKRYQEANRIKDALGLRANAYRVLLTRGREGCVVFIPPIAGEMDETKQYLMSCGFKEL